MKKAITQAKIDKLPADHPERILFAGQKEREKRETDGRKVNEKRMKEIKAAVDPNAKG